MKKNKRYPKLEDVPKFDNLKDLFKDITKICNDSRVHIFHDDTLDWVDYKFRIIKKLLRKNKDILKKYALIEKVKCCGNCEHAMCSWYVEGGGQDCQKWELIHEKK